MYPTTGARNAPAPSLGSLWSLKEAFNAIVLGRELFGLAK
jgi:hypothetical protein